jgi:gliding motility-associated-like protein
LTIFNRWGQIVFHTTNPTDGWDGTYRNKEALAGTYGYVLIFQDEAGKKFKRVGSLHLIR